jgi:hypothetical protein
MPQPVHEADVKLLRVYRDDTSFPVVKLFIFLETSLKLTPLTQWYITGLRAGWSGVRVPVGATDFFLTPASRPVLGPTQPPIQWVPGVLSLEVKRPGREADHSPPSSAEVKNA